MDSFEKLGTTPSILTFALRGSQRRKERTNKPKISQVNKSNLYQKTLKKKEQTKSKVNKRKDIIKIRVETSEIETKNNKDINKTKSWLFEKINKMDKTVASLKKRQSAQINKIRNERKNLEPTSQK